MSNQNAGYTVQTPAVAFSANLGSLRSNIRFYQERGELRDDALHELHLAAKILDVAVRMMTDREKQDG